MENKKQYIAPTMKCVEFKVERGYAVSQGVGNNILGDASTYNFFEDPNDFRHSGQCYRGYFTGDNSDWD